MTETFVITGFRRLGKDGGKFERFSAILNGTPIVGTGTFYRNDSHDDGGRMEGRLYNGPRQYLCRKVNIRISSEKTTIMIEAE